MRVSIFYIVLMAGSIQLLMASTVRSQGLDDMAVTVEMNDEPLDRLFEKIEQQTSLKFVFGKYALERYTTISMPRAKRSVKATLELAFHNTSLMYELFNSNVLIFDQEEADQKEDEPKMDEKAKVYLIRGKVTDSQGEPVVGANVLVKGTTRGTVTDVAGQYAIDAEDGEILIFSFIGFVTHEVEVNGRTVIDITLQQDIASLDEVVINAGYYETTKETQTGNIVKITAKDIAQQPVSDPITALQGRVAGMEVTQPSGIPGSNVTVRIRGTNSISSGNDPLYIIDGVPYISNSMSFGETSGSILSYGTSPLNNINPSDIQSIEVLKDADATAIYGSRGANGVILITTKKGQAGRTKVDVNFYTGISQVPNKMDLLNTDQYLEMRREAFANDGVTPSTSNARDLLVWDTTRYTDWQDKLIGGTASVTDGQISISGGNYNTQFRIGTGYRRETTVFPGDNSNKRVSFQASINNRSLNEKLTTSFSLNYSVTTTDLLSQDLTSKALSLVPNAPALYDSVGNLNWDGWTSSYENPLAFLERSFEATTKNLVANSVVSYAIFPNLHLKANLGYTNTTNNAVTVMPISSLSPDATQINRSNFSRSEFNNWIVEPQLNWSQQIGDGNLEVLVGTTFLEQTNEGLAQYASGFTSESLMKNISAASEIINGTNYYSQYRYHAVFGRINYNYKSRYIVNLTARRDGSSRFGPGKQFAVFKAIGAAWIFTNESFIQSALPFLSYGKLRASYGTTGNDQIGDYQYLDSYEIGEEYQGIIGLSPARLYNANFAWEENKKLEFGLELGAINDRVLLGISYYRNRSSSQLVGRPLAPTTGFSSIQANFPATIQNTGVELELNTLNIKKEGFTWSTSINLTIPNNELLEFPDIAEFPEYDQQYVVGQPLTISKRYNYTGIDPETGYYTVEDVNEDGSYNFEDRQKAGFLGRNYYGGLQNSFTFKGFQLDILCQYINQEGYNYARAFSSAPGTLYNQPDLVLNRVEESGDSAPVQKFATSGAGVTAFNRYATSNDIIGNASFFRVKNISLSYTFPNAWLQPMKLSDVRIFVQGQNLFTFTDYVGLSPENPGSTSLPSLRTVTAGVHLTF